jgi:hypothetical protein
VPQRRALAGPAPRQEQRAPRGLAEPGREHRRLAAQLGELLERGGRGREQPGVAAVEAGAVGQAHDEAVVGPQQLDVEAERGPRGVLREHRPRRHDPRAERRQHAHPQIAEIVARHLDHDGAVGGHRGHPRLLGELADQHLGRGRRQRQFADQPIVSGRRRRRRQLARERAHALAQLVAAHRRLAAPERHLARARRGRRHQHAVVGDVVDAPGRGAEHEATSPTATRRPSPRRAHRPDAPAGPASPTEEDAVEAAVGDRAAAGDRDAVGAVARAQLAGRAVPVEPRPQLGELVEG